MKNDHFNANKSTSTGVHVCNESENHIKYADLDEENITFCNTVTRNNIMTVNSEVNDMDEGIEVDPLVNDFRLEDLGSPIPLTGFSIGSFGRFSRYQCSCLGGNVCSCCLVHGTRPKEHTGEKTITETDDQPQPQMNNMDEEEGERAGPSKRIKLLPKRWNRLDSDNKS